MRTAVRVLLLALAAAQGLAALTQLFAPRWFYDDGPWVSGHPPYNEHLMRDVGAATLGWVMVIIAAGLTLRPMLVRLAVAANLIFSVPHAVFHLTHLHGYAGADLVGQVVLFSLGVALPALALLLFELSERGRRGRTRTPDRSR